MPRGFNWYKVDDFPSFTVGERIDTGGQLRHADLPSRSAYSRLKFLGDSEHDSFSKYFVEHEIERSIKHRIHEDIRDKVVQIVEFHIYQHKDGYFFIDTNLDNLRELIGRLQDTWPDGLLLFKTRTIDLIRLKDYVEQGSGGTGVSGGHFRDLRINRVRAASIFGPDVGESELWDELSGKGQLTGVWLNFEFYGEPASIMVTSHGGVLTFASYGEKTVLELVEDINKYIEPFSKEIALSPLRRRRQ